MEVNSHLLVIVAKCDEQAMWMNNFLAGGEKGKHYCKFSLAQGHEL